MITKKSDNPIAQIYRGYQKIVPSPIAQGAILAALTIPGTYLANRIIYNRAKRLAQDPRTAAAAGLTPQKARQTVQDIEDSPIMKHALPWGLGALAFTLGAYPHLNTRFQNWGLTSWHPKLLDEYKQKGMNKTEKLQKLASLWGQSSYQPQLDLNAPVSQMRAADIFAKNPYIQDHPYEKNLGTSIVMGAPAYGNQTTLGGIYDSAVNKFDKKLSYQGFAGKAIKSVAAGTLAGLFTDTVGAALGIGDPGRRSLANSVGIGTALYNILT